jgi:hypothetical protein
MRSARSSNVPNFESNRDQRQAVRCRHIEDVLRRLDPCNAGFANVCAALLTFLGLFKSGFAIAKPRWGSVRWNKDGIARKGRIDSKPFEAPHVGR